MPGLDRLGDLLEQVRAAGTPVELSVTGERRPLDPGIELSAYRIIQEALTNALRHAPGARARVAVGYGPTALDIQVEDDGRRGTTGATCRRPRSRAPATASSACASGSRSSAASSRQDRPSAASASRPACRSHGSAA